ncbi:AraC family transcriptional regulator [Aminithiophilus ramosus]|uniref:AraC family transcriptional regulator n=2 Tax=Synergistales TaxID=649776 RepID=A0A9Q7EVM9_9BACT|nr:AraC family transcriptional regulator [Aminithiophilus ramosus]QTX32573.1 AraC family transcriptional regulator [Aminithiophilus ramosus]QVL36453.1 AraC family transcriptional regulator [Synergistota bacterium]
MRERIREDYERCVGEAQRRIQENLEHLPTLEELAGLCGFSRFHFCRLFAGLTGESPGRYAHRLRLERAAWSLRYSGRSVVDIALEAGYERPESFSRAFSVHFGLNPSRYRRGRNVVHHGRFGTPPMASSPDRKGGIVMEVHVKRFDPIPVAYIRHVGPYAACEASWVKLCSSPKVLEAAGPQALAIGVCYDDPDVTPADKIRFDVCLSLSGPFESAEGISFQVIEGGEYAVFLYKGSYDGLHAAYRRLYGEWLPGSGREPKGSCSLEIYLNDPSTTTPEELLTEIRIPLV